MDSVYYLPLGVALNSVSKSGFVTARWQLCTRFSSSQVVETTNRTTEQAR